MNKLKLSTKFAIILGLLIILPNSLLMLLHETKNSFDAHLLLFIYTTMIFVFIFPLSKIIAYIVTNNDLLRINKRLNKAKNGEYKEYFSLPVQKENEDEIVKLKRNINWLIHRVSTRENTLHNKLESEKNSKKVFKEKSYIDSLTQIYNRRYFDETINSLLKTSYTNQTNIALIIIDCDHFKSINDTHGHQAGDSVLQLLGKILSKSVRSTEDYPFRYGGDEFGIVLLNTPDSRLQTIGDSIKNRFKRDNEYSATLSIGIANLRPSSNCTITPENLKAIADKALYESKENGKDQVNIKFITE